MKNDILKNLPTHQPPDLVWEQIEARLDETKTKTMPLRTIWLAAASVATLLVAGLWFLNIIQKTPDKEHITYSTEKFDKSLIVKPSDTIEEQCAVIEKFCETKANSCEKPAFKTLKNELDQLNAARRQLKEAIGNYNTDPFLLAQLTDIETERADIVKKLTAKI
jgi:hypothetical protein